MTLEDKVQEFQTKFETPTDPEFWAGLIAEELTETEEAIAHLLKEISDLQYVVSGFFNVCGRDSKRAKETLSPDLLDRVECLADLLDYGLSRVEYEAFDRVHESNMSKLGDDGKPVRREDGKVLKGPNYHPPYLLDLVNPKHYKNETSKD